MEELKVYETFNRKDIEEIIKGNIKTVDEKFAQIAPLFVRTGYYLRRQFDEKMYEDAGFDKFEDYVKETYRKSRSWAKRMIQINEKFSVDGNSPLMDEQFVGYSVSHLQEMIYLTDEQLEEVTPDMTVKEIREIRKPESEKKISPIQRGCITGKIPHGNCVCCGANGVECCSECEENCNGRCGWLDERKKCKFDETIDCTAEGCMEVAKSLGLDCKVSCCQECAESCGARCRYSALSEKTDVCDVAQTENIIPEEEQLPGQMEIYEYPEVCPEETIIDSTCSVIETEEPEELFEEQTEDSDLDIVRKELDKANKMLNDMLECYTENDFRVRKQKILVAALASYSCDLDNILNPPPAPMQPELPVLKNMEQREAFILNYKTWPVWCKNEKTEETYYRYDLPDGSSIVIREYPYNLGWRNEECTGKELFLLKSDTKHFKDGETNMTTLKEHLKEVQKNGK